MSTEQRQSVRKTESKNQEGIDVMSNGSAGFFTLLGLLFIGLKLTGYVDWSWWVVLSPIYVPIVLGLTLLGVALYVVKKMP